ncbi:hypothetical protein [Synechocystis sp. PCC 7509]|nr:hypothetical protein [Synechocystis sp. PCC 7509]
MSDRTKYQQYCDSASARAVLRILNRGKHHGRQRSSSRAIAAR